MPSMKEYLSFASKMLLAFGFVFELPLVLTFLARMGVVTVPFLTKNRKYTILLFFVMSALITPPDVVTQIMMALPLMLLYELSIVGARIFGKEPAAQSEEDTEDNEEDDEDSANSEGNKDDDDENGDDSENNEDGDGEKEEDDEHGKDNEESNDEDSTDIDQKEDDQTSLRAR